MRKRPLFFVGTLLFTIAAGTTFEREAKVYSIKLKNVADIESDSDHLSVVFVRRVGF